MIATVRYPWRENAVTIVSRCCAISRTFVSWSRTSVPESRLMCASHDSPPKVVDSTNAETTSRPVSRMSASRRARLAASALANAGTIPAHRAVRLDEDEEDVGAPARGRGRTRSAAPAGERACPRRSSRRRTGPPAAHEDRRHRFRDRDARPASVRRDAARRRSTSTPPASAVSTRRRAAVVGRIAHAAECPADAARRRAAGAARRRQRRRRPATACATKASIAPTSGM